MCSRLLIGSASMPSRPSRLVAVVATRSRIRSASPMRSAGGAANDFTIDSGRPASASPACRWRTRPRRVRRAMRPPSWSHFARPFFHRSACAAAQSSGDLPFRRASSSSIHGRKSDAERFGNVSSRSPRSPFGSITIAGMPSIAASSSKSMQRPVLPLPVMPTQTACVTRSVESYSRYPGLVVFDAESIARPR